MLGAALFDLMGALAIGVARIDDRVDRAEIDAIADHFVADWGFDPAYIEQAIRVLVANAGAIDIEEVARQLANFQNQNPDCNAAGMRAELTVFLRDIATADDVLDKREEQALDAVAEIMAETSMGMVNQIQEGASRTFSAATGIVSELATKFASVDAGRLNPFREDSPRSGEEKS